MRRSRLGLEPLEDRIALSVAPLVGDSETAEPQLGSIVSNPQPATYYISGFRLSNGTETTTQLELVTFEPTSLMFGSSAPLSEVGGASGEHSATNLANYQLLRNGLDVSYLISAVNLPSRDSAGYLPGGASLSLSSPLSGGDYEFRISRDIESANDQPQSISVYDPGFTFAVPETLTRTAEVRVGLTTDWNDPETTEIATDAVGNYVIAWHGPERSNTFSSIAFQRFDRGGARIGGVVEVSDETDISNVRVAMNPAGQFLVTWSRATIHVYHGIFARLYDADGTPLGDQMELESTIGGTDKVDANAVLEADGHFTVVWQTTKSYDSKIEAQRFDPSGTKIGSPLLSRPGFSPEIATNANGDYVVVWEDGHFETGKAAIFAQQFTATGSPKDDVFQVNTSSTSARNPSITLNASGSFVVAWEAWEQAQEPSRVRIYARLYGADGASLGDEFQIDAGMNSEHKYSKYPAVAVDGDGNFLASWSAYNSSPSESWGSYIVCMLAFDADGKAQGAPLTVSEVGSNNAHFSPPLVATQAVGEWVAAWAMQGENDSVHTRQFSVHRPSVDLNGSAAGRDIEIPVPSIGSTPIAIGPDDLQLGDEPNGQLDSAKITIQNPLPGDMLQVDLLGTSIAAAYSDGALSLAGTDSVAHYQQVLRSLRFATIGNRPPDSSVRVNVVVKNGSITSLVANSTLYVPGSASLLDRRVFYNNSGFDGANAAIGPADDLAIAADKVALLPGQAASFANYTSYSRGINGLMLDIAGSHGAISADDFTFKVGNNSSPDAWSPAPTPLSLGVRAGAGLSGSNRVQIIWADGAMTNTWLQVIMHANSDTGLASPDTFYFGNAIGDTGNSPTSAAVTAQDVAGTIWHVLRQSSAAIPVVSSFDHNHDGRYTGRDVLIAIQPLLRPQPLLALISPPVGAIALTLVSDSNNIASALAAKPPNISASESDTRMRPPTGSFAPALEFPGEDHRSVSAAIDQWPDTIVGCWLDEDEPDAEETAFSTMPASLDRLI